MADDLQSYSGRWVAQVRGQVVGVGLTAEAARAAAQLSRPKETPQVMFVPDNPPISLPDLLSDVRRALPADARVWVVGGAVRDALLNRRVRDLDFAVDGDATKMARTVAKALDGAYYPLDPDRD